MNHSGLVSCMTDIVFAAALAHGAIQALHQGPLMALPNAAGADDDGSKCAQQSDAPQRYLDRLAQVLVTGEGFELPPACEPRR